MNEIIYKKYNLELVEESKDVYPSVQVQYIKNKKVSSSAVVNEINKVIKLNKKPEEHLILICLNTKNYINGIFEVSHGGIDSTTCRISNILKRALLTNSNKIIISHNHPSGDPSPSKYDYRFTNDLYDVAQLVGIELVDHIIVGRDDYISLLHERKVGVT